MIRAEHLKMNLDGTAILRDVSLTVKDGEIVGIIGPSGSGKSFLLRCIATLEKPEGTICLDDKELTGSGKNSLILSQKIGMVFQNFNLFPHMSVVENVMSGMVDLKKMRKAEAYEKALALLRQVGLADKAYLYPAALSGGQQQRTAIARTLAMEPDILLMDEPTSGLDPMMRGEIKSIIRMLAAEGHTMIIVTHEMELVREVCHRVVFMDDGEIIEEGTPEAIFDAPVKNKTKRFTRALRVLEFLVESRNYDFIGTQTDIAEFAYRNGIPDDLVLRMRSIVEEFFNMVILQPEQENKMHILFEYEDKNGARALNAEFRFSGVPFDPDDPLFFISWPIICMRSEVTGIEQIDEGGFTNRIFLKLK